MSENIIERDGRKFIAVCNSRDVVERQGTKAELDKFIDVALFRLSGTCYALSNVCPHQHSPVIFEGVIEHDTVVCPMHGWQFKIRTGDEITQMGRIRTYMTFEEDGMVYVEYDPDEKPSWMNEAF